MTVTVDRRETQDAQASDRLASVDPEVWAAMIGERDRQAWKIELIASENYASRAVLEARARGSRTSTPRVTREALLRGLRGRRRGRELAIERANALFPAPSTSTCSPTRARRRTWPCTSRCSTPGDTVLGMGLAHGGHLTHGSPVDSPASGSRASPTASRRRTSASTTTRSRARRGSTAEADRRRRHRLPAHDRLRAASARSPATIGALLMVDMAHIAGLVAGGLHPSPVPARRHRDHDDPQDAARTARRHGLCCTGHAPRSTRRSSRARRAARSCTSSPPRPSRWRGARAGVPGGPAPDRREREGARRDARRRGFRLVSGGTDNHLLLVDVTPCGVTGKEAEQAARRRGHHRQQERHPVRPAAAEHGLGHPHRHAGRDDARLRPCRDGARRDAHRAGLAGPRRLLADGGAFARGPRYLRALPRAGVATGVNLDFEDVPFIVAAFIAAGAAAFFLTPLAMRFADGPAPSTNPMKVVVSTSCPSARRWPGGGGRVRRGVDRRAPRQRQARDDHRLRADAHGSESSTSGACRPDGRRALAAAFGFIDDRWQVRARWQFLCSSSWPALALAWAC